MVVAEALGVAVAVALGVAVAVALGVAVAVVVVLGVAVAVALGVGVAVALGVAVAEAAMEEVAEVAMGRLRDTRRQSLRKAADGYCDPYASPAVMQELYDGAMIRKDASDRWRMPAGHFLNLRATFGDRVHFISAAPASAIRTAADRHRLFMGTLR